MQNKSWAFVCVPQSTLTCSDCTRERKTSQRSQWSNAACCWSKLPYRGALAIQSSPYVLHAQTPKISSPHPSPTPRWALRTKNSVVGDICALATSSLCSLSTTQAATPMLGAPSGLTVGGLRGYPTRHVKLLVATNSQNFVLLRSMLIGSWQKGGDAHPTANTLHCCDFVGG